MNKKYIRISSVCVTLLLRVCDTHTCMCVCAHMHTCKSITLEKKKNFSPSWLKCVSMPWGPGTEQTSLALMKVLHLFTSTLCPPTSFWWNHRAQPKRLLPTVIINDTLLHIFCAQWVTERERERERSSPLWQICLSRHSCGMMTDRQAGWFAWLLGLKEIPHAGIFR